MFVNYFAFCLQSILYLSVPSHCYLMSSWFILMCLLQGRKSPLLYQNHCICSCTIILTLDYLFTLLPLVILLVMIVVKCWWCFCSSTTHIGSVSFYFICYSVVSISPQLYYILFLLPRSAAIEDVVRRLGRLEESSSQFGQVSSITHISNMHANVLFCLFTFSLILNFHF